MSIKVGKVTLITLTEAEKQFGVSRMTLLRAIKRGELKGFSIVQRTLVKPEDVRKWVEKFYNREMAERAKKRWQKKETKKKTQRA
ncbi:MAG: helix-turn-helix domain-containing protein [Archaeoglobaceae archaeon]